MRLHRKGVPVRQIARELALSRNTVRRWMRGEQLWRDLRNAGFTGGMRVVTEWASRQRLAGPAPAPETKPLPRSATYPARRVARMLTADLPSLAEPDRAYVERLLSLSPALAMVRDLAQHFGALVRARSADEITPWLAQAGNSDLRSFAAGLHQDEQAVRAALTLPWSSGQVEGQVSRLKLIKRQGYGRAKLDLLRARLVHAA